ncbi:hypothetical protein SBRCBS47491_009849 [Sporothrix bragantina]|uniref:Major facilitator superfamily (MFS) profile domain-containing protein n=1 Tax=Sporothrix bragantina TaxID=671064 RepID=A0ABP0CY54_9PEZI
MDAAENNTAKVAASASPAASTKTPGEMVELTSSPAAWTKYIPGPGPNFRYEGLSPQASRIGVLVCGCACLMLSGINVALMGSVSSTSSYLKVVNLADGTPHTTLLVGVINALYWVGVIIGALFIGPFSDIVGRRRAIVCAGIYGIIVIPIFASLQSFGWALALRFLNGLATGSFDSVGLNWAAEAADARMRGWSTGIQLACAAFGGSQSFFLVYGIGKATQSQLVWRFPIAYQCVFVLFVSTLVWFLPESPRWLVRVGLTEEAREVMIAMGADRADADTVARYADEAVAAISAALEEEVANNASATYVKMFFAKDEYKTVRRTWSALFVQFATQAMVGVGVVSGYGNQIFVAGGWSADLATLLAGIGIVVQALFGLLGAFYADRFGRRCSFIYGSLLGAILLALIGMCGHYVATETDPARVKAYSSAVIALVFLWSAVFGFTWLWAPFAYPTEIFPLRCRARGSSIGICGLALGSFFTNMISTYLFNGLGYKAMFLFCGLSFVVTIISFLWLPETAMKTLEEIDHIYEK